MTDIYIAYAREDRERIRPIAEMLQFEGWDVWWDPSEPTLDSSAALDQKLGTAGAILVVWSGYSRGSEYVRSEAATGLYKNKLIQARVDSAAPPRPFDQVEVVNLAGWRGERDDPEWRRIVQAIRLYAGQPGIARQQQQQTAAKKPLIPKLTPTKPTYLERDRIVAWGPMIAAGVLVVSAGGVWWLDPFKWRSQGANTQAQADTPAPASTPDASLASVTPENFEDTPESLAGWDAVDRKEPQSLRDYIVGYPKASTAETARSLLRVLDAQAWVDAVTSDNEAGYSAYLRNFPVDGSVPGAAAGDARDRLVSLSAERTQAVEKIQRGLLALELYEGEVDGKGGAGTVTAMRKFASSRKRTAPSLTSSAPRDLRSFADLVEKTAIDSGAMQAPAPIIAAAATTTPTAPAAATTTTPPRPRTATPAEEADRQRIARAQEAAERAADEAAAEKEERDQAEKLAASTLNKLEAAAWTEAQRTGTAASYQAYLASYPSGPQATAARAAIQRLNRAPSFSLDQISPAVRTAAEAARRAQSVAASRAAAARQTAASVQSAPGITNINGRDGARYESQMSGAGPNGLGTRVSGGTNAGDRYRGEISNGQTQGLGVYEFADNPSNARSNTLRYEGEHAGDSVAGYGVTYWKNGDSFAGQDTGGGLRGVLTYSNGQKYEGEMRNGMRNGLGVVWSSEGQVLMSGRWENGQLVEPMSGSGAISLTPGSSSNP